MRISSQLAHSFAAGGNPKVTDSLSVLRRAQEVDAGDSDIDTVMLYFHSI